MRIFITGSTDGLGLEAGRALIGQGHEVVLHARTRARAQAVADLGLDLAGLVVGDLRSAAQTRGIAEQVNAIGRMDTVIHNAGIYQTADRDPTEDGHAGILAVNTLAPYRLTALIERPARIIYLSSGLHRGGEGSLRDIDWLARRWDAGQAYAESKLHGAALARVLARRWPGVLAHAVDPGWVRTRMGGASAPVDLETGGRTQVWLATSDEQAAQVSGGYWHRQGLEDPAGEVADTAFQDRLLARLAELTGVDLA